LAELADRQRMLYPQRDCTTNRLPFRCRTGKVRWQDQRSNRYAMPPMQKKSQSTYEDLLFLKKTKILVPSEKWIITSYITRLF